MELGFIKRDTLVQQYHGEELVAKVVAQKW